MISLEDILNHPSYADFIILTFVFKELGKVDLNFLLMLCHLNNFSIPSHTCGLLIFQKNPLKSHNS